MGFSDLFKPRKTNKALTITRNIPADHSYPKNFIPIISKVDEYSDEALIKLFNTVAEPNSIITYIAQVWASLPCKHVTITPSTQKEKEVKNSWALQLLNNPNQLTNGNELKMNALTYFFVVGNDYLNFIKPVGFDKPSQVYLLPSQNIYPIPKGAEDEFGKLPQGYDIRQIELLKYNWKVDNKIYSIPKEEILHIKDSSIDTVLKGKSRLSAAVKNIKTLAYACETINTLLANQGALGFVKKITRAGEVDARLTDVSDGIKDAEERYHNRYGTIDGKTATMFTPLDLNYVKTSSNIAEFQPIDLSDHEFKILCMVLGGFPDSIFKATDTTFTNLSTAEKILIVNIIKPFDEVFYGAVNSYFQKMGWFAENEFLKTDYSDIKALQDDIKTKAEGEKVNDEVWLNRYNNNLCTLNELLTAIGLEPRKSDGGKYKKDLEPEIEENEIDEGANNQTESGQTEED